MYRMQQQSVSKNYDPELNKISKDVRMLLKATKTIWLGQRQYIPVKPQRLARAIVGHLLAGGLSPDNSPVKAACPDALREYFLDPMAPLPDKLDIYYWLYRSFLTYKNLK